MKRYAVLLALALLLLMPTTVAAAECQFILGFKTLRDLIGHEIVGECLENEHHNHTGDSVQQTTGGLLVWRKADNWTAFTDGYRTWINGPNGLVQRLNTERIEWEADYAPGGGIATPTPTPTPVATASPTPTPEPTPIPMPTPNPESIRKIEQAIAALPWVQDGLGNVVERRANIELWELAAASPQVFWAWIESFARDTNIGTNINKLVHVSAVAQSDEWAALQMLQTPFIKSRETTYGLRTLKFMADLETLSPGSLRQAFAHPKLRNGITDDHIVTFTLLALGIKDPEAAAAIEALPWVRDGVDRPEDDTHYNAYHPTEHEYEAVVNLIEIGLKSPQTLMTLVSKPWVQDSNAEREKAAFWRIEQLAEWDSDSTVQIVAMPFLETFEIGDYDILRNLSEVRYANGGFLRHVVSHPAFVGGITDDHVATVNLVALEVLNPTAGDEISAFSWIQDGVSHLEQNALNALLELAVTVPESLDILALTAWMRDGITFDEMFLLYRFGGFPQDDAIRIVSMPFLDSPDDTDFAAVASLVNLQGFLGTKYLKEVLNHPTLRDGITDDTAGLVAVLHNVSKHRPDLLSVLLDPEQSIRERRTISLPRGGETKLEVVRTHPGSPHTMDLLEEVVRFHEEFMLEAFPKRFLTALVFDELAGIAGESHARGAITISRDDDHRIIAHEVAHSYWSGFPVWIAEGAATFMEQVAVRAREGVPVRTYTKGECQIADSLLAYEEYEIPPGEAFNRGCSYTLGSGLFVDLYFALGDWEFRQGFRRLYVAIRDGHYSAECDGPRSGICYVGAAFVKYASPEAAAIAGPIVHRWYYG